MKANFFVPVDISMYLEGFLVRSFWIEGGVGVAQKNAGL